MSRKILGYIWLATKAFSEALAIFLLWFVLGVIRDNTDWGTTNIKSELTSGVFVGFVLAGAVGVVKLVVVFLPNDVLVSSLHRRGVYGVMKRGDRKDAQWHKTLRKAKQTLVFFGKDHSKLFEKSLDVLRELIASGRTIQLYFLDDGCEYYKQPEGEEEKPDRAAAWKRMRELRAFFNGDPIAQNRLQVFTHHEPRFSYTQFDNKTIYYGHYVPNGKNPDTVEFVVRNTGDESLWNTYETAFRTAANASTTKRVY